MALRPGFALCAALALALGSAHASAVGAQGVARILGVSIERSELSDGGQDAVLGALYDRIWSAVSRRYVEEHALGATADELAQFEAYERDFELRDRAQRARKLEELDQRLAGTGLEGAERSHLEEFRAVLARLAQQDAERDRAPPPDPAQEAQARRQWIELWKMSEALYRQYGGVVALTRFGPFPHGARLALIQDYERRGLLAFTDAELRGQLYALLAARPSMTLPPDQVDFTPFWKKPIPASYFPE